MTPLISVGLSLHQITLATSGRGSLVHGAYHLTFNPCSQSTRQLACPVCLQSLRHFLPLCYVTVVVMKRESISIQLGVWGTQHTQHKSIIPPFMDCADDWHNRSQTTPTTTNWPPIMPIQLEGRPFFDPANRSASLPTVGWSQRSMSRDPELAEIPGKLPSVRASLEFLTYSQQRPRDDTAEASTATPAEAVTHRAMAEERTVLRERMKKEESESEIGRA